MNEIKIQKYITLDLEICTSNDISYPEWILCSQIQFLSVKKGYCYAKQKTLAKALKMTVRGLQKMTDRLIEKGLIKRHKNMGLMVTNKWREFQEIKTPSEEQSSNKSRTKFASKHEQSSPKVRTKFASKHEQSSPPTIKRDILSVDTKKKVTNELVTNSESYFVANYLLEKIKTNQPNFKQPNIDTWAKDIDKGMRLDNRSKQELINCIDYIYSQAGSFWQSNILSGKKLREKFDTIEIQSKSRRTKQTVQEHAESMSDISPYDLLIEEDRLQKLEQERLLNE